jgi:hypothetical protein
MTHDRSGAIRFAGVCLSDSRGRLGCLGPSPCSLVADGESDIIAVSKSPLDEINASLMGSRDTCGNFFFSFKASFISKITNVGFFEIVRG